jgi:predicted AlkP superfamily pyrophosphatase or phosphodiesterase
MRKSTAFQGKNFFALFVCIFLLGGLAQSQDTPYVIMISFDGFRWDYPEMAELPTFDSIAATGVKAAFLKPSFPSVTFPNHYTMVTGLYPDHHGIVANRFYDPIIGKHYSIGNRRAVEDSSFYRGEPIWVTAENQGVKTASFFWVGSEAPIMGIRPSFWKKYDEKISFNQRVDTVMYWLSRPENQRPRLILFYYHEPDASGHQFGPESAELKPVLVDLDQKLKYFIRKLKTLPIFEKINLIITADHGMQTTPEEHTVMLTNYIKPSLFERIEGSSPLLLFQSTPEMNSEAYQALKKIPHTQCWKSAEMPDKFHYGTNPRTLDFVLLADSSWTVMKDHNDRIPKGAHGFDPDNVNMHAIFYATGPAFKKGYVLTGFDNIDLYPFLSRILNLSPAVVDGNIEHLKDILN